MKRCSARGQPARRGAAFLFVVILILLVIVGATRSLVRSELTNRQSERQKDRARTMRTAINVVKSSGLAEVPVRFPVDPAADEYIEVTMNAAETEILASWLKGERVTDKMRQPIELKVESSQ